MTNENTKLDATKFITLMLQSIAFNTDSEGQVLLFYTEEIRTMYCRSCCLKTYTVAFTVVKRPAHYFELNG